MDDFTFLTDEQCFDKRKKLKIFTIRGVIAPITDFAILCGGHVSYNWRYNKGNKLDSRAGSYWTCSSDKNNDAYIVGYYGTKDWCNITNRFICARPVLSYDSIAGSCFGEKIASDGILEVKYGEYPQKAASYKMQIELEEKFNNCLLENTSKKYIIDCRKNNKNNVRSLYKEIDEYLYEGKKYVRVLANSCYDGDYFLLSNGKKYKDGDFVWVEVSPIKWLVDYKQNIALSEKLLFSGQFNKCRNYKGDFSSMDIKIFMNECFAKDIQTTYDYQENIQKIKCKKLF